MRAILDVNLGGENSFSVADALKRRGIPFAFATGDSGVDSAPRLSAIRSCCKSRSTSTG